MQILGFLNLGTGEAVLLSVIALPFLFTLYCVIDIVRTEFKDGNSKILFLILVLLAPLIGSIVYLILRRSFVKPNEPFNP